MDALADNFAANRALRLYLRHAEGKLPPALFEEVEHEADTPSIVDAVSNTAELLYANRDRLDDEGRTVVAQLAAYGAQGPWHRLGEDNRGARIALAMRRDMGDKPAPGQSFPDAADDPEPLKWLIRADPAPSDDAKAG